MIWLESGTILTWDGASAAVRTEVPEEAVGEEEFTRDCLFAFAQYQSGNLSNSQVSAKYYSLYKAHAPESIQPTLFHILELVIFSNDEDIRLKLLQISKNDIENDEKTLEVITLCQYLLTKNETEFQNFYAEKNGTKETGEKIYSAYLKYESNINTLTGQLSKHLSPLIGGGNTVFDQDILHFLTGGPIECQSWLSSVVLNNIFKFHINKSLLQEIIKEEIHVENDIIYELLLLSNNSFTIIHDLFSTDNLFIFLFTHLIHKSRVLSLRGSFLIFIDSSYQLLDEVTSTLDPNLQVFLPFIFWSMNEILRNNQSEEIRNNLISRIRKLWPSIKQLFDTREISEIIGESQEFDDFISEIISCQFDNVNLNIDDKNIKNLSDEIFDENSLIEFLNVNFVHCTKQQKLELLQNESVLPILKNEEFSHEKINENILMNLMEASIETYDTEIIEMFQEWMFEYIAKNDKLPEYSIF